MRPAVVWTPNVELFLLLANLTDQGPTFQPRAVHAMRRAAWLRYDASRRAPAVVETARLLADGLFLDDLVEIALTAEPAPRAGFAYPLSRELIARAAGGDDEDGFGRLSRYLEYAAAFTLDGDVLGFLRLQGEAYRAAVAQFEEAVGDADWIEPIETWFGTGHRGYVSSASLLMPAGFAFGLALPTPGGPLAFHVAGPFVEPDGRMTFGAPDLARASGERETIRAFVKPIVARHQLAARAFATAFERSRQVWAPLGYESPWTCLEDHLVQVVHARVLARRGEPEAAGALLAFDEESGWRYTRYFATALEEYEAHRSEFPTFDAYFSRLMDDFGAS